MVYEITRGTTDWPIGGYGSVNCMMEEKPEARVKAIVIL